MHIIQLDRVTINYAGRVIFRDLSWAIGARDRIGLIGPNGVGKSSLLTIVAGNRAPDGGTVSRVRDLQIGYLPQDVVLTPGRTVLEEASILPPVLAQVEEELKRLEQQLADPAIYGNAIALERVLERQQQTLDRFEALGGSRHNSTVRETLKQLGFAPADLTLETSTLSGGEKKLVLLARLAVAAPNVLLLDEPDNHLDLEAKRSLGLFLRQYAGAVVIISHDRYLLDDVATQIAELDNGTLTVYKGNYSAYVTERELRRLRQQQMYTAQQKDIARIEAAIQRFEHWASIVVDERHIRQARSRRKMLERMETNGEMIARVTERRTIDLQLEGGRGSTKALEITDLAMGFGDSLLLLDGQLLIRHGERVGLVGPNGAGKSVLFKLILGELTPLDGEIVIGPSTRIGYYAQEHQTLLPWWDRTPLDMVSDVAAKRENEAVALLMKFLFTYEQTRQPIGTMSGGERSRLQLINLMLQRPNFLLLDEPTNNLDIPSMEVLERALDDFEGSLLIISHDRYFLDQVVDQVVEIDDAALRPYAGGYTDYLLAKGQLS